MKNKLLLLLLIPAISFSQKKWSLKECVDRALEKNISVQQNQLNVNLAKKDVAIAKGNFLPNLTASTGGNLNFGTGFDPVSQDRVNTSLFGGGIRANSAITVFNGYRNTYIYKQAQLGIKSSLLDLKKIKNDISLFIVNGYLNILFAKENLNIANVQYKISSNQIKVTERRFESGIIPKGDLLNAQSTAAADLQRVVAQENALNLALLNLAQALQIPANDFDILSVNVDNQLTNLLYKNSSVIYNKSLERLPEIERAKLSLENAKLATQISKSSFLPTITASASLSSNYRYNLNLPEGFSNTNLYEQLNDNFGYGAGFSINIPIFNRFQTKNNVAKSLINQELSKTRLENEKLQLKQTIEQAFLDAKAALKNYEASKISLSAQKEAFKNAQERYNNGVITLFDLDLVRIRFVNAESSLIRSKYDYVFKTKVLQFYSGELTF